MEKKDRLKKIGKYFLGMNVVPDNGEFLMYVEVTFPAKWMILDETNEKYGVNVIRNDNGNGYYFWASSENEENLFDAIDANIKVNEDAEAKVRLLMAKIEELKNIFADESMELSTLQTLEFKFTTKPKSSNKIKALTTQPAEVTTVTTEVDPEATKEVLTNE